MNMLPKWLTTTDSEFSELKVAGNSLFVALIGPTSDSPSHGSLLESADISRLKDENLFSKWLAIPLATGSNYSFRLIGPQSLFPNFQNLFKKNNFKEGTHVVLTEETTLQFFPFGGRIRKQKRNKVKVLVVDDSETIRKILSRVIAEDPEMECVATIEKPSLVIEAINKFKPDVITLDIHMPEMDGVTLLKRYLPKYPIPTVMISALSREDGTYVLDALEVGAVDYIQKPSLAELKNLAPAICEKIKSASAAKVSINTGPLVTPNISIPLATANDIDPSYLIAIGSSTGGTEALKTVLTQMPENIPPVLIVQHIPPVFSKAFADRMNQICKFEVKEAEDGETVKTRCVYIAPGGRQMKIKAVGPDLKIVIDDSPPVNRHRPSVDYLFDSIAALKRKKVVAVILTGMGNDGAKGLLKLKETGAQTMAQNEATSVVFGMPKEALKLGATDLALPLEQIAFQLLSACSYGKRTKSA